MLNRRTLLLSGAALAAATASGRAQDYPSRAIRIVVPLAAGGMADILARTIAAKITETTSHSVVVENRTGGAGVIGADAVAKSPADGYTLLMGLHATQAILVGLWLAGPLLRSWQRELVKWSFAADGSGSTISPGLKLSGTIPLSGGMPESAREEPLQNDQLDEMIERLHLALLYSGGVRRWLRQRGRRGM